MVGQEKTAGRFAWRPWLVGVGLAAIVVDIVLWARPPGASGALAVLDTLASVVIVLWLAYLGVHAARWIQRRVLWRVRRKLILSYVFIGFIPVALLVVFITLVATLGLLSTGSLLVSLSLGRVVDVAHAAAAEASAYANRQAALDPEAMGGVTRQVQQQLADRYPGASVAVVGLGETIATGPWANGGISEGIPAWVPASGFAGLVAPPDREGRMLTARHVTRIGPAEESVLVIDLPLAQAFDQVEAETGVEVAGISTIDGTSASGSGAGLASAGNLAWFAFVESTAWDTGETEYLNLQILIPPLAVYERIFGSQARLGEISVGYILLIALAGVGGLFLIIEVAALVIGLVLARSITGSVHELFVGTEHVRRGDFAHRVVVRTHDQLGELGESFNAMTSSVTRLLREAREKKRLEDELRIARDIQMSLLPRDLASVPGIELAATCVPAREVGGDYYDVVRLGDRRLGVLVADVSGKGTSAAFYMAELKGLFLSLSRVHESPRDLLVEVNRLMAPQIDSRSFITMMYAVIDLDAGTLTYARAGHTPLIHVTTSDPSAQVRAARALLPGGLVVGLAGFQDKFDELLEEQVVPLADGDVVALYTDGVTEAMNRESDLFGADRLERLLERHAASRADLMKEQIVATVGQFVGDAHQHDDLTMVVIKINSSRGAAPESARAAVGTG